MPAPDGGAEDRVTALIGAIGASYQEGRRYRPIAERCETEILGRALAIGGALRSARRAGTWSRDFEQAATQELAALAAAAETVIAEVRTSALYRRALAAWTAGDAAALASAVPALFVGVTRVAPSGRLFVPVPIVAGRGADHFLPPAACADRVATLVGEGLVPPPEPPDLGADAAIRAVILAGDAEALNVPLVVGLDAAALSCPLFRVEPVGDVLCYRERLRAPLVAGVAIETADEWWATRPDEWTRWRDELGSELVARGIAVQEITSRA